MSSAPGTPKIPPWLCSHLFFSPPFFLSSYSPGLLPLGATWPLAGPDIHPTSLAPLSTNSCKSTGWFLLAQLETPTLLHPIPMVEGILYFCRPGRVQGTAWEVGGGVSPTQAINVITTGGAGEQHQMGGVGGGQSMQRWQERGGGGREGSRRNKDHIMAPF